MKIEHKNMLVNTNQISKIELPYKITDYCNSLIDWKEKNSAIKKMYICSSEKKEDENFLLLDSSKECDNTKLKGLQHKYSQTVLLLVTNECYAHCKYCFRKRLVGVSKDEILENVSKAIEYIDNHKEVSNVLISGGDPLTLTNDYLKNLLNRIAIIDHIKYIRIGTKIPVVDPIRIIENKELLETLCQLTKKGKRVYIVTHFNHPNEITINSKKAISSLTESGLIVLNQSVLLKGVNDDPNVLEKLMVGIVQIGIIPYYIFQMRPISSNYDSFKVSFKRGCSIIDETKKRLDGLSKSFRYIMSHSTGKIEILGEDTGKIYFKYHQAKERNLSGKMFFIDLNNEKENIFWLKD